MEASKIKTNKQGMDSEKDLKIMEKANSDIAKATKEAAEKALTSGVDLCYVENGFLIQRSASGEKTILRKIEQVSFNSGRTFTL